MDTMFNPVNEEDFFASVDRGLAQLDAGLGRDAFESLDEMTSELEAGYKAMKAAGETNRRQAAMS